MPNRVLVTFMGLNLLFAGTGGALIGVVLTFRKGMSSMPTIANVATNLLLSQIPLEGVLINAILILFTFLVSVPGMLRSKNRFFLKAHSWLVIGTGIVTLVLGLTIWYSTLKTRSNLGHLWAQQTPQEQSMLQERFNCCGYLNSTSPSFQIDTICPTTAAAAKLPGCIGPFSSFANNYLDIMFTALFGLVGLDGFLFFSGVVVLKDRAERERYRLIDEKNDVGGI